MTKTWIDPPVISIPDDLTESIGGHPLVADILVRRGFSDPEEARAFLNPESYTPAPATDLPGIEKAVERIERAIQQGGKILVWGDFDVDGQTSTTILVEALRELGAKVEYHIPVRLTEGHGIQAEVLEQILDESATDISLILSCDTGITAYEAVDYAKSRGLGVIITDHHDLPEKLPAAYAIINPKLLPVDHPLATLPGVGVAYKLIEALMDPRRQPADRSHPDKYLDLVALGIVADVAEQTGDTRYLLQRGLEVLRNIPRLGLQTMMGLAEIIPTQIDETTIGFGIGPRLNALGRLSDANPIVEFLTTQDSARSRVLATQLEGLNERRKLLTEQITQAALAQMDQDRTLFDQPVLVLSHPGWHTGVIGVVASRLVERFGKPTILFSIGEDGMARGSARSIEGVHITQAIAIQKELLTGFGGHPGAAGLSLPAEAIPQFRRGLGRAVRAQLGDQPPESTLQVDAYLSLEELSLDLVDEIERLAPFGAGNPALTLASTNLKLVSHTVIGHGREHLRLVVADGLGNHQSVLWWNGAGSPLPDMETPFDLAYTLQASTFRGERQLQIQWLDFRPLAESKPESQVETPIWDVVDYRKEAHPLAILKSIQDEDLQIWAEGKAKSVLGGYDRNELSPGKKLVVWTTPPGPREWHSVLRWVNPPTIYLFAIDPQMDTAQTLLERLAGLVKFVLRTKEGEVDLSALASATAQRENTIRMGILWLEANGFIQIIRRDEATFWLTPGDGNVSPDLPEINQELKAMLDETAAYRAYFQTTKTGLAHHSSMVP